MHHLEANAVVRALAAQVRGWLFRAADEPRSTVADYLFSLRMRERWQDRVPYVLFLLPGYLHQVIVPNEHDHALLPLPRPFMFLSYGVRPVRLMGHYGWPAVKHLWQVVHRGAIPR